MNWILCKYYFFPSDFSGDKRTLSTSPVTETQTNMEPSASSPISNMSPPLRGFYGHPYGASPYMPYSGSLLSGHFPNMSANFTSPLLHSSSLFPPSAMHRPMSSPALNSSHPGNSGLLEHPLSQCISVPTMTGAADQTTGSLSAAEDSLLKPDGATAGAIGGQSFESSPDSGLGVSPNFSGYYRHYYPTQRSGHTSLLPDPPFIASGSPRLHMGIGTGTSLDLDHNKHITSLLNEIDAQRQEARKV